MNRTYRCIFAVVLSLWLPLCCLGQTSQPTATTRVALPAAANLLTSPQWQYRLPAEPAYVDQAPQIQPDKNVTAYAKCHFNLPPHEAGVGYQLSADVGSFGIASLSVNGKSLPLLPGMLYRAVYIPSSLPPGPNQIEITLLARVVTQPTKLEGLRKARLVPLHEEDLQLVAGPALGAFGEDFFSVTCETNLPAKVTVVGADDANGAALASSPEGFFHRLRVPCKLAAAKVIVVAQAGRTLVRKTATFSRPHGDHLRFVLIGDNRTFPDTWRRIAADALATRPQFTVLSGDFVMDGRRKWYWPREFFEPAAELLATAPMYPVLGNHDAGASYCDEMFYWPGKNGRGHNWVQKIGPMLLIGISGDDDFSKSSKNYQWLAQTLESNRDSQFVFLVSHYPPFSSGNHGASLGGLLAERQMKQANEFIIPLLGEHRATAFLAGHDHCYERLQASNGVTVIVSGGGGAELQKSRSPLDSSKVLLYRNHYCLFDIQNGACTMRAIDIDGHEIDTVTWPRRSFGKD